MAARTGTAHVVTTTRKYKDQVYRTHLLRRSYREDGKVKNETLGNLSHLPDALIEIIRRSLQGETFVPLAAGASRSRARARTATCRRWRARCSAWAWPRCSPPSPAASATWCWRWWPRASSRPHTKLATTRWWHTTTLAEDFGVAEADEDDLYAAMDWLLERQDAIQKKLAARHLSAGGLVLYDLSSSYFEGSCCPLAKLRLQPRRQEGHAAGQLRPAHRCARLPGGGVGARGQHRRQRRPSCPQVQRLREDFGIEQLVMVGDRGMISSKAIDELRETERHRLDHAR